MVKVQEGTTLRRFLALNRDALFGARLFEDKQGAWFTHNPRSIFDFQRNGQRTFGVLRSAGLPVSRQCHAPLPRAYNSLLSQNQECKRLTLAFSVVWRILLTKALD
jgi:hypothetical protein